nr:unnamed protein product [Callosobruchus analis]
MPTTADSAETSCKPTRAKENAVHQRCLRRLAGPHSHTALRKTTIQGCGGLYTAHSLSWSRVKEPHPNGIMHAKVWVPEDPRASKDSPNSSSYNPPE